MPYEDRTWDFLHHCVSFTLPGLHHPAYGKLYWLFNAEWIACVFQRTTKAAGEKCLSPPLPGHFQFSPHKTPRKGHIAYFECLVTQSKNSFFFPGNFALTALQRGIPKQKITLSSPTWNGLVESLTLPAIGLNTHYGYIFLHNGGS